MTTDQYRPALDAAIKEYEDLVEQRRHIDRRLSQLGQTIGTLNRLCGLVPTVQFGLTDGCRFVLSAGHPMTATEIRDRLEAMGFDLSKYVNALAAVHTVLKRLREAGEVSFVELDSGKFAYERLSAPKMIALNEGELADLVRGGNVSDIESRAAAKMAARSKKPSASRSKKRATK